MKQGFLGGQGFLEDVAIVDNSKRRFLTTTATIVGGVGATVAAVPFVAYLAPSERTKAVGGPIEIDISGILPGKMKRFQWQGKPVWVLRRTAEDIASLKSKGSHLSDPLSKVAQQPEYVDPAHRSINSEYLVVVGLCTHLGCSPNFVSRQDGLALIGEDWLGGFFCPCHGSRFDLAGRVYQGVPAPTNLLVPPHYYLDKHTIVVGESQAKTS